MFKKIVSGLVIMGSIVALVGLTGCRHCGHSKWCDKDPQKRADMIIKKVKTKLNLDPTQEASLRLLVTKVQAVKTEMHKGAADHHEALLAMVESDALDTEKIKSLMEEKKRVLESHSDEVLALMSDFHKTLNAEQKKKATSFLRDHMGKCGGHSK